MGCERRTKYREFLKSQRTRCVICGQVCGRRGTLEHLIPKARGGVTTVGNLALACGDCNRMKGNRTIEELQRDLLMAARAFRQRRRMLTVAAE